MASQTENVLQIVSAIFSWVDRHELEMTAKYGSWTATVQIQVETKPYAFRIVGFEGSVYSPYIDTALFWIHIPETELPIARMVVDLVNRYINNK